MDVEYTVVFTGHPKNIKGNPFDMVTDFGRVTVISAANACDDADAFRDVLDEIADMGGKAGELARAVLNARNSALTANLRAGLSK